MPDSVWWFGFAQAILILLMGAWINRSVTHKQSIFLENLKLEFKTKEQAIRVAEYLAFAPYLTEHSSAEDYERARRLSMELAIWLPEDIYREMVRSIVNPNEGTNAFTTTILVRKLLLQEGAGSLSANELATHGPGIGAKSLAK